MSEKRFKVDYEVGVLDTLTNEIICDTVNAMEVVDLLNEFETKCHKLEKEIRLLKPTNIEQYEQIVQLQEENEQLKQEIVIYKKAFQEQVQRCSL